MNGSIVTCPTCGSDGMVPAGSGEYVRCGACHGQGFVRAAAVARDQGGEEATVPDLDKLRVAELRAVAEQHGLDPSGKRDALIARIRAAAVARDQGGDASPADDPAAPSTGEAGTPPEEATSSAG